MNDDECLLHGFLARTDISFSLEKCAKEDGVLVSYQKNPDAATGTCAVLVNGGERSLVANLAAANTFTQEFLKKRAKN